MVIGYDVRFSDANGRGMTQNPCYGSGKEKISPELKGKMLTELAQYKYPKRKAIGHTVEAGGTIADAMKRGLARVQEMK